MNAFPTQLYFHLIVSIILCKHRELNETIPYFSFLMLKNNRYRMTEVTVLIMYHQQSSLNRLLFYQCVIKNKDINNHRLKYKSYTSAHDVLLEQNEYFLNFLFFNLCSCSIS